MGLRDLDEAEALNRNLGDQRGLAMTLGTRGSLKCDRRNFDGALRDLDEAEALNRKLGDQRGLAMTLCNRAGILECLQDIEHAILDLKEALMLTVAVEGDLIRR